MFLYLEVLVCAIALFATLYYYLTSTYDYWRSKRVPGPNPILLFGNVKEIITGHQNLGTFLESIYKNYRDEPLVGIYSAREPILVVNDVDIVKDIMVKDFGVFSDRGIQITKKHDPLLFNLVNLEPKLWRPLRAKLTPTFTSGKLKKMFYLLLQCADEWEKQLKRIDRRCVDIRNVTGKFTTEAIGVCAFGLKANSMSDENSVFHKMAMRIFGTDVRSTLRLKLLLQMPRLYKYFFGYFLRDTVLDNFILKLTRDAMNYRRKNNIYRHDFIDLLMDIRSKGKIEDMEMTDELMASQLLIFLVGGSETSSTTISNALYELAMNPGIQVKLRNEILGELEKNEGKITYDGVNRMQYLDKVFKETLRKYPPAPFTLRRSVTPYKFKNTNLTIPTNMKVWIPILGIHRDPKYYPQPDVFDPERFTDEAINERPEMTYLAFGCGPRNCIGARFGTMQTKIGIIMVVKNYSVEICDKTDVNYEIDTKASLLAPKNGVFLALAKRSS